MTSRILSGAAAGVLALSVLAATPVHAAASSPAAPAAAGAAEAVGFAQIDAAPSGTLLPRSTFTVAGVLGNKLPRTVQLRHTSGATTRTVATTTSTADGRFTFTRVSVPTSGTLVATTPEQTVEVAAGQAAQERLEKGRRKVTTLTKTVKKRKKAKVKAARKVAKARAKSGTTGKQMGRLLRASGKAKIKLRVARKALKRARGRVVVLQAALVRRVTVKRAESKPVTVTVVQSQSSSAAALPPIAQAGATAAAPSTGAVVSARFVPARPGRTVWLEQQVAGQWSRVAQQAQDRSGHAVFSAASGRTYRAVALATAEADAVTTAPVTTKSWKVDFSDTFSGSALDTGKWTPSVEDGRGLRTCATYDASSYKVAGGVLRMGVSKDPTKKGTCAYTDDKGVEHQLPYMRNTQVDSRSGYSFTYGFAAARIKVQKAVGMHSAFWSQPMTAAVAGRPDKGVEVDVMEYFGDYPREDGIATFQHVLQSNGSVVKSGRMFPETALMKADAPFSSQYHVFSVEWTKDRYVFRMDGREYHRTTRDVSRVPQYLLLSMLTSSYELVNLKKFDDVASVDWVQVWK